MIFDRNEKKEVIALLGAGSMGTAIVRRIAAGRKVLLGDISEKNLEKVSHDFQYSGYDVETMIVNARGKCGGISTYEKHKYCVVLLPNFRDRYLCIESCVPERNIRQIPVR